MAYIGKGVIGVEHPSTSALTATSVTSTGAVSGTTGTFSGAVSGTSLTGSTSLKTPLIEFTDGDDAITIADGGEVSFSQPFAVNPKLQGSPVSLSGLANKDFTIPSGTNRFTVTLDDVSGPTSGNLEVRLGTSGGIISSSSYVNHNSNGTAGNSFEGYGETATEFSLTAWTANAAKMTGTLQFTHFGGNFWFMDSSILSPPYNAYFIAWRGKISLGAECTTVRIFPNPSGSGNFDDGNANLLLG